VAQLERRPGPGQEVGQGSGGLDVHADKHKPQR
jgi:hypothetical protein